MPHYLHQVSYTPEAWATLIANPQDRIDAVTPAIEKLGGKVKEAYFAFGEHDVFLISEMPDNVSAAAIAMAFAAGGACRAVTTVPLMSRQEALKAIKKAGTSGYKSLVKKAGA